MNRQTYVSATHACGIEDNHSARGSQAAYARHARMMEKHPKESRPRCDEKRAGKLDPKKNLDPNVIETL